jgi:hypothetical protein
VPRHRSEASSPGLLGTLQVVLPSLGFAQASLAGPLRLQYGNTAALAFQ